MQNVVTNSEYLVTVPDQMATKTVGVASAELYAGGSRLIGRKGIWLYNGGTYAITLGIGVPAVIGAGIVVNPGDILPFPIFLNPDDPIGIAINAIAGTSNPGVVVREWR